MSVILASPTSPILAVVPPLLSRMLLVFRSLHNMVRALVDAPCSPSSCNRNSLEVLAQPEDGVQPQDGWQGHIMQHVIKLEHHLSQSVQSLPVDDATTVQKVEAVRDSRRTAPFVNILGWDQPYSASRRISPPVGDARGVQEVEAVRDVQCQRPSLAPPGVFPRFVRRQRMPQVAA